MSMPLMPFAGGRPDKSLKNLVRNAGLLANAELILDPGDRNSWPGSGTTWFDVSGNGVHFKLGSTASPVASGPTFVGTVGARSDNEYWNSPSGGVGFSLNAGTNPAFFETMHKSGFNFSIVELVYQTGGYGAGFTTKTGAINSQNVGVSTFQAAGYFVSEIIGNGSSNVSRVSATAGGANAIYMYGIGAKYISATSRDANDYVNGTFAQSNGGGTFNPSASNAGLAARYGLTSDGSTAMSAGRRSYGLMIFDHMLLQTEYDALRAQLLKRFPTI